MSGNNDLRNSLMQCFQDTYQCSYSESLQNYTYRSINSNTVYPENFTASILRRCNEFGRIYLHDVTTFKAAAMYGSSGRTAVLNFANPENPGGGVRNGAMAQEECLCRSSNLYACISNENVFQDYYNYHRTYPNNYLYSDRLIYTKDVLAQHLICLRIKRVQFRNYSSCSNAESKISLRQPGKIRSII